MTQSMIVRYAGNQAGNTVNEGPGPSPFIWSNFLNWEKYHGDRNKAVWFEDYFCDFAPVSAGAEANYGRYKGFADTGGSVVANTGVGGGAIFSSDGDNEGASIRQPSFPFKISRTSGRFAFEAALKSSTITDTKHGIFVGLCEDAAFSATVPIAAAGTLADKNLVGFHRLEGDGDQLDSVYKADGVTQVSVQNDALPSDYVLVADTYVKVAMTFDPADYTFTWYANGLAFTTTKTIPSADGTDFPNDVNLGLVFAVLNATGTTPGNSTLRWWRAMQLVDL